VCQTFGFHEYIGTLFPSHYCIGLWSYLPPLSVAQQLVCLSKKRPFSGVVLLSYWLEHTQTIRQRRRETILDVHIKSPTTFSLEYILILLPINFINWSLSINCLALRIEQMHYEKHFERAPQVIFILESLWTSITEDA
jgi:hypothetical protein